jgi:hypothetical protein
MSAEQKQEGISQEVDYILSGGGGVSREVAQEISKRVRDRYRYRIDSEIQNELRSAESHAREAFIRQRQKLQDRICAGETTGDPAKDIIFAVTGHLAENNLESISGVLKKFDEAFAREENPLVLNMYLFNQEIRTWSIAKLEKPGISLKKDGVGLIYARLSTNGHSDFFDGLGKPEYYNFPITLMSFDDIESSIPFEEAYEAGNVEGREFFLLGAKDIRSTLEIHSDLALKVMPALQLYLEKSDDTLKSMGDNIRFGEASQLMLGKIYERFGSHEALGSTVKDIPDRLSEITNRTKAENEIKTRVIKAMMLKEIGGYIDEFGNVSWLNEAGRKSTALQALAEASEIARTLDK